MSTLEVWLGSINSHAEKEEEEKFLRRHTDWYQESANQVPLREPPSSLHNHTTIDMHHSTYSRAKSIICKLTNHFLLLLGMFSMDRVE